MDCASITKGMGKLCSTELLHRLFEKQLAAESADKTAIIFDRKKFEFPFWVPASNYTNLIFFVYSLRRHFEIWAADILPGAEHQGE